MVIFILIIVTAIYVSIQRNRAESALKDARIQRQKAEAESKKANDALQLASSHGAEAERQKSRAEEEKRYNSWLSNLMTWQMIMNDENPNTFKAYLDIDKEGGFADKARKRLKELEAKSSQSTPNEVPQTTGIIRGKVHDGQRQHLAGATIKVKAQGKDWEITMFSNKEGDFMVPVPTPGAYTLTIEFGGYKQAKAIPIRVNPSEIKKIPDRLTGLTKKAEDPS